MSYNDTAAISPGTPSNAVIQTLDRHETIHHPRSVADELIVTVLLLSRVDTAALIRWLLSLPPTDDRPYLAGAATTWRIYWWFILLFSVGGWHHCLAAVFTTSLISSTSRYIPPGLIPRYRSFLSGIPVLLCSCCVSHYPAFFPTNLRPQRGSPLQCSALLTMTWLDIITLNVGSPFAKAFHPGRPKTICMGMHWWCWGQQKGGCVW